MEGAGELVADSYGECLLGCLRWHLATLRSAQAARNPIELVLEFVEGIDFEDLHWEGENGLQRAIADRIRREFPTPYPKSSD